VANGGRKNDFNRFAVFFLAWGAMLISEIFLEWASV
jgi:hypothetical protein